ncbi:MULTISPECIES: PH domain-containing protein [Amycolatopsis]|uniref:PH (Pleckstrin Homology) domain-containing protein n=1 Tax=Amycolatopsis thermoflava TaxID=84480 RepID=A0A3N2GU90_9PSEU|nr:PH domain-containing protein [Amycolatopsis thermoflava]ROS40174.1 PH (Pleckstrin Homology) domain-containing protein [Amycolatopsis thermoflava]
MAYPDDLLSENEQVIVHSHPHAKMLIWPVTGFLVTLGLGIWLVTLAGDAPAPWNDVARIAIAVVAVVLIVWFFLVPLVRWRTTHFIVTTDRLIVREGVIKRTGIDIPLGRISSVQFEHGIVDRLFGCGTLVIESASDEPLRFEDIPRVERVHTMIYRQVNDNPYDDFPGEQGPQPRGRGVR